MLLRDLLKEFILELEIRNYSKRTLKGYKNNNSLMFTYLEKEFNITDVEDVKPAHIKSYVKFLQRQGRKTTYINGIIKCFRAFFKYITDEEIIENNPMLKVNWLREGKVIINSFDDDEVNRMMKVYTGSDYMNIRNKCILAILFDTGIRNLELCSIKNDDVKETYLTVKQGKGRKDRRVALSPYVRRIIIRYVRCRDSYFANRNVDEATPFFLSYRFKPLTIESVERVMKIAGEKAEIRKDIRCSPHTARHFYAISQLRNGLDVYSLSRCLGHENISITKRYLQGLKDEQIVEMSVKTSPLMNLRK
ncbi:integrase [Clostridium beijerinckii]|uniref:Tyrosine-type recombinase/integrase n=1 Tax=Clostridium beijerinckii TaxID=1520 RepID=A0AB74VDS5_CLOBE|nr:tyrosine-type recombinase/integrase [Clostridium beijerinckii]NRZ28773.1 integrase/recombinase XerD [Clostridium beijerinckii]NYB95451.1 integrase/recombinase XerD [Clostridium beijerinckii]OOM24566.1 tyrosine recombinase XerC [Clostridium beijerinckii]QUN34449.1 tyrosine-type recombinase/integrase [Clostridium beijerinckii]SQB00595.1 tyrosine recombinase XerC [Clostridium beijerinckii]